MLFSYLLQGDINCVKSLTYGNGGESYIEKRGIYAF